jgi:hypothetical protein
MALLRDMFGDRPISKVIWPSRSPDLTPPDFYLWRVSRSIRDMKEAKIYFNRNISHTELVQVFTNKIKREDAPLQSRGEANSNTYCNRKHTQHNLLPTGAQGLFTHLYIQMSPFVIRR